MVAVIKTGSSIRRAFYYNEQKVKEGVAQCIAAANYPKDVSHLTLSNKLNLLLHRAALNENVTRNSVHISLNFAPSERLSPDRLGEIADAYTQKIGFGSQPYLVYQHHDAGHPHIHIVTTKVRADGSRIDTQNIGRNQSQKARREIEQSFGLKQAEDSTLLMQEYGLKPVNVQKVQYGKMDTRRAITAVLDKVLNTYKYTSLPELNVVLQPYNVVADRGRENTRLYQKAGLVYRILDERGNKTGIPIKASIIYNKPTLKYLQERFSGNEAARQPHKARLKNAIDLTLLKNPGHSVQSLSASLAKEGIATMLRQNESGILYGITYVDHRTKCVFNGSDLGKGYSAKGIQERCTPIEILQPMQNGQRQLVEPVELHSGLTEKHQKTAFGQSAAPTTFPMLDNLLQPAPLNDYLPHQLKNARRKKRNRLSNNP